MPSNSEMYECGAVDAEQDDLDTFYYQHYYSYRRGYDDTRRRMRGGFFATYPAWLLPLLSVIGVGVVVCIVAVLLIGMLSSRQVPKRAALTSIPAPVASVQPALSSVMPSLVPSPTLIPTPTAPTLRIGGQARVINVGTTLLRVRTKPSLDPTISIITRVPQGTTVTVLEGPRELDGQIWWRIRHNTYEGWSIGYSAAGETFLEPVP